MTTPIQPQTQPQLQAQPILNPTPTPQIIQVQLPAQIAQPSASTPPVQGDIITFLTLIALTVLVKLLTDKS
jgi:hypothetical protein